MTDVEVIVVHRKRDYHDTQECHHNIPGRGATCPDFV